jgi:hypothetical protein
MKTKNMALLLLSATMLAGCGKVNEVPANNSEALDAIKKNADAVIDGDSISADAKISELNLSFSGAGESIDAKADWISAKTVAEGIHSSDPAKFKASTDIGGSNAEFSFETATSGSGSLSSKKISGSASSLTAKAYVSDGTVYADMSDEKTVSFGNAVASAFGGDATLTAGKYAYGGLLDGKLPLIGNDWASRISSAVGFASDMAEKYPDSVKSYSTGVGYKTDITITDDVYHKLIASAEESGKAVSSSSDGGIGEAISEMIYSLAESVSLKKATASVETFADGSLSLSAGLDASMSLSVPTDLSDATVGQSVKASVAFDLTATVRKGGTVGLPDDLTSYAKVS